MALGPVWLVTSWVLSDTSLPSCIKVPLRKVTDGVATYSRGSKLTIVGFTEPPVITDPPPLGLIVENETVTLPCMCHGVPEPSVTWITPHRHSLTGGSRLANIQVVSDGLLSIRRLTRQQSGDYVCLCESEAGSDSLTISLRVSCKSSR